MNTTKSKAVVLDHLLSISIDQFSKVFVLKRIGTSRKSILLHLIHPLTGERVSGTSILVESNIDLGDRNDYVKLTYTLGGTLITQQINLAARKNTIKGGVIYFFECPIAGSLHQKLFLYDGNFVSRKAIPNCHYSCQTLSSKQRREIRSIRKLMKDHQTVKQAGKRHFRKYYDGNLTKRYMSVLDALDSLNRSW